eukprot:15349479-Ditylum_brightwellii.AAC.1
MKELPNGPKLSDAFKRSRIEHEQINEQRLMLWKEYLSTKMIECMRQSARVNALAFQEQLVQLNHLTHDHDQWKCALNNYYCQYLQVGLTDKTHKHIVQYLQLSNNDGLNVLHCAMLARNATFVDFLTQKGADPYAETKIGNVRMGGTWNMSRLTFSLDSVSFCGGNWQFEYLSSTRAA